MDLSETIKLDATVIKQTEKAWQVKLPSGFYWLPKSQCRMVNNKIYIPKWLADSKQIEYLDIDIE